MNSVVEPTEQLSLFEMEEFEIPCDVSKMRVRDGYPPCKGDPAKWVAWRPHRCPGWPHYRLLCDFCKTTYQNWMARQARIICGGCRVETGGFASFTPLDKGGKS